MLQMIIQGALDKKSTKTKRINNQSREQSKVVRKSKKLRKKGIKDRKKPSGTQKKAKELPDIHIWDMNR